eukprot:NODE_39585_length_169_cov_5.033333_g38415_i0.p3 GENE.NODE_39585_length_169_cov_5.033333_g38415_i0~~NODE_39585_length_169_cov_5.033333_g38415_i0.p3  ORF type:complete len:51 (+),score=8.36 NODE_39585_length_169_cov_5.033333_g38415_i0:3-155(+)
MNFLALRASCALRAPAAFGRQTCFAGLTTQALRAWARAFGPACWLSASRS